MVLLVSLCVSHPRHGSITATAGKNDVGDKPPEVNSCDRAAVTFAGNVGIIKIHLVEQ